RDDRQGARSGGARPNRDGAPREGGGYRGPRQDRDDRAPAGRSGAPRSGGAGERRYAPPRDDRPGSRSGGPRQDRESAPREGGGYQGARQDRDGGTGRYGSPRDDRSAGYRGERSGGSRPSTRDDRPRDGQRSQGRSGAPWSPAENRERPRPVNDDPFLPDDVTGDELDPDARAELLTLPKDLATRVARHLVMAGRLVDDDAAAAYRHARAARRLASRVGVVREACGFAAYHAGEWADALAELRAARRLPGREGAYLPVMADCERGLGRPERALDLAKSPEAKRLPTEERVELRIVESGARRDLGQYAAAVVTLQIPELKDRRLRPWSVRLLYAYADALADAGREDEARDWFAKAAAADRDGDTDAAERLADLEGLEIIDTEDGESEIDTEDGESEGDPMTADSGVEPAVRDSEEEPTTADEEETAVFDEVLPPSAAEIVLSEAGVPGIEFSAGEESPTVTPSDAVPEVSFSPPPSAPPEAPGKPAHSEE
ncbi:MAG: hypothetical protein JWN52_3612, partial [Actinomycetia bacterium]|nr:hypothetical protein [Actinomycetes bacterium]